MNKIKEFKEFILDTSVILSTHDCIYKFEDNDVTIPIQVIKELETFKVGTDTKNYHAREFGRLIDGLSGDNVFNGGVSLGHGLGKLRIALKIPFHEKVSYNLKDDSVDSCIINLAYVTQEKDPKKEVIIVSKDRYLRVLAKALKIKAQDYLNEVISNTDILITEPLKVEVQNELIEDLFTRKKIIYQDFEKDTGNRTLLISSGKKTALGIFHKNTGEINLVQKDSFFTSGIKPKNAEQAFAINFLLDPTISLVAIEGKAGTGKTLITLACALSLLKEDIYDQIFFTRQTISAGNREIGFLPGDVNKKIELYMNGFYDNLKVLKEIHTNNSIISEFENKEKIVSEPLSFIRGRSLRRVFFIIDEAQNLTPHEVKTLITRAGEGTKIVFLGDTAQIDSPYLDKNSNGLSHLIDKFIKQPCFGYVHLIKGERSHLADLAGKLL